jgi:hypothetical protein
MKWDTSASSCDNDINLLGKNINTPIKKNTETVLNASKEVGLEAN